MKINDVIIPAAGLGTRFLPFTKAVPKEMVPLGNRPAIHLVVKEALDADLKNMNIIISKDKDAIKKYFSPYPQLEKQLKTSGKIERLAGLQQILNTAHFEYICQEKPLGLGHAIGLAATHVTGDYFGIMLPDDIVFSKQPGIGQLIEVARKYNASVIAVQEILDERISAYGVVDIKQQISDDLVEISNLVEKPKAQDAPSRLGIIGRYVLSIKLFEALKHIEPSANGELQLTDAITYLAKECNEKVLAYTIKGTRHDTGTPQGWFKAIADLSAQDKLAIY